MFGISAVFDSVLASLSQLFTGKIVEVITGLFSGVLG